MKKIFCVAVIFLFVLSSSIPASAATGPDYWVGNISTNLGDDNWSEYSANSPPAPLDSWVFDGAYEPSETTLDNNLTSGYSVAGITFNSDASAFTINGNSITLTGAIANNSSNTETIGMGIASGTITNSGTGSGSTIITGDVASSVTSITEDSPSSALTISGAISVNSSGTTITNSNSSGSSLLTVSGGLSGPGNLVLNNNSSIADGITLSGASVNNSGTITNSGTGSGSTLISADIGSNVSSIIQDSSTSSLILSGDNAYTGNTTINAGILNIQNANALGTGAGTTVVASGGTLQIQGGITTAAEALTLNGTGVSGNGAVENVSGNNTYAGLVTLGSDTQINSDSGTLTLSNAGTITGSGYGLTIDGAGNTTIDSIIGTGSTGTLMQNSTGTLILTGANTYGGITTISGGTLQIGNGGTTGNLGTGSVTDNSNLTFDLTSSPLVSNAISGTGTVTQNGTGTVTLSGANTYTGATAVNAGTLEAGIADQAFGVGSAVSVGVGGTLDLGGYNETIGSLAGAGTITNSGVTSPTILTAGGNNGSTTFSGTIEDGASTIGLTKVGNGTLILSSANNYSGNTSVSAGILNIQNNDALGTGAGSVSVASGATLQMQGGITTPSEALTINGTGVSNNGALENVSGNNTYAGLVTLGSDTQINSDAGSLTLSNTGTITASGYDLTVGGAGNTTIDSIIGTGVDTLTKEGAGTLTLSGVNTFTGGVNFNEGTINATALSNLGNGGELTFNGGSLQFGGVFDPSSLTMTFNSGGATFDTNGQSITFNDSVGNGGVGGLTKIGAGTLTLNTTNSYSGGTTVNGGTLTVGSSGTLGSTTGPLSVNNTNTGAGDDVVLNLSTSAPTTTGSLSGTIAIPSSGTNTATINNGGTGNTFIVNQAANGAYDGVIAGAGGFTLGSSSTSTLALNGDNTYSGGTTISAGTLQVGNSNALGTGNVTVANNATLNLGTTSLLLNSGIQSYTQSTGSTLDLTADTASIYGKITSAVAASVAAGSTINVTVGGYIQNGSVLEIINSGGTGIGNVPSTVTSTSPLVSFSSSILDNNLVLTASNSGFAPLANNINARAVGTALDNITNPSSDMANVLNTLAVSSNAQITSALNSMGPQIDGGVVQNSNASLNNLVSATLDRIQSSLDGTAASGSSNTTGVSSGDTSTPDPGIWAKPYGSYLTQGTLQGIQGYDAWNAGTVVGYDRMINDNFTLGISGGYAYGQVDSDVNDASTDISSAQGTVYAGYQNPALNYYIEGTASFAWNWYDGQRDISVGDINRTADADYDGQQYGTYVEGGYKFNLGSWTLTPLASLQWTHLAIDSYAETGAGALDLNVDSQSYDFLESGLGASISYPQRFDWGNFTPEFHAKWLYDYIDDDMVITSSFTGGGPSFTTTGAAPAKEGADIGSKLSLDFTNNLSFIAAIDAELKDEFFGVYGSGTVRYKF